MTFAKTLRYRLTAWYCFALGCVLLVFGVSLYGVIRHHLVHHHDEPLRASAFTILNILAEQDDCHDLSAQQVEKLGRVGKLALIHEDRGERTLFFKSPEWVEGPLEPVVTRLPLKGETGLQFELIQIGADPWRILSLPYQTRTGRHGVIRVMENMGDIQETLEALRVALLVLAPVGLLISALGGYWLSGKALAPVGQITAMAQEIEATDLGKRLPHPGADSEIGRLVDTLNRMFSRLNASFETMKRFTADASHELRSPLATMRNTIDIMLERPRTLEEHQATLQSIGEEVARLSLIVDDLLLLARVDAGRISLAMEPVRLARIAEAQVEAHRDQAEAAGIFIEVNPSPDAVVLGNERWLHQLLGNLIGNALKFTPREGHVAVSVIKIEGGFQLVVEDSGPGIPEEALEKVFDRFYRVDQARSREFASGSGLGLAIAAWIADVHRADIRATNRPEGGAAFCVRFKSQPD